jgi:hypothetical protein
VTGSGSGSASLNQSKSQSQSQSHSQPQSQSQRDEPRRASALGEQNKLMRSQSQSARSNTHAMDGGRKIMGPLDGVDNIRSAPGSDRRTSGSAGKMTSDPYASRHATKGNPEGFTPSPRVRIVSADHQGEKSNGVMRSTLTRGPSGPGHTTTMGDLTGLTGMLATPAKGLLYRRLGEDGQRSGQGGECLR